MCRPCGCCCPPPTARPRPAVRCQNSIAITGATPGPTENHPGVPAVQRSLLRPLGQDRAGDGSPDPSGSARVNQEPEPHVSAPGWSDLLGVLTSRKAPGVDRRWSHRTLVARQLRCRPSSSTKRPWCRRSSKLAAIHSPNADGHERSRLVLVHTQRHELLQSPSTADKIPSKAIGQAGRCPRKPIRSPIRCRSKSPGGISPRPPSTKSIWRTSLAGKAASFAVMEAATAVWTKLEPGHD